MKLYDLLVLDKQTNIWLQCIRRIDVQGNTKKENTESGFENAGTRTGIVFILVGRSAGNRPDTKRLAEFQYAWKK
ncbi:MAG: hypothetical protein ACFNMA_05685 [Treponema socranskii subsp. buccale]